MFRYTEQEYEEKEFINEEENEWWTDYFFQMSTHEIWSSDILLESKDHNSKGEEGNVNII